MISFPERPVSRTVVKSISFDLKSGTTLGLVGESGSGKSVTALAIMGLLSRRTQVGGQIVFGSKNLVGLSEKQFREFRGARISIIFQEPMTSLNPVSRCGNQVSEVIALHRAISGKEIRQEALDLFTEVELPDPPAIYERYPHQLSGGQRQRVMIAMALASNPELIIADEPTTALDVTVQKTIIDLLIQIKASRGMSMLFISHDLALVSQVADQVLVMYRGEIVERGTPWQLFNHPVHPYTRGLLACRPQANQGMSRLPVMKDFMTVSPEGKILETSLTLADFQHHHLLVPSIEDLRREQMYRQPPLLTVRSLCKRFNQVHAVLDVSFSLYPGEILGLVGESGCGKSTLGRSLLRLIEPDSGQIIFRGQNLMDLDKASMRRLRQKMQIIFQDPYSSLNPRQTIGATLVEPMEIFGLGNSPGERKEKVLEILHRVQLLPEHFERYPHEFSGGQRQRIGIARALSVNPEFIVCDESVSALDVSIQAQILNLLLTLRQELSLTLLFISHDLSVVRFLADRILVMNKGQIEEVGTPDQLYHHPKKDYTRKLIQAIP